MKFCNVNGNVVWCWKFILVINWLTFKEVAFYILKYYMFCFFSTIEHPKGKCGKSSSISLRTDVVFPINALNLFSKSYSGLELTKSKTVRQSSFC
jgi:hypothetical protein